MGSFVKFLEGFIVALTVLLVILLVIAIAIIAMNDSEALRVVAVLLLIGTTGGLVNVIRSD